MAQCFNERTGFVLEYDSVCGRWLIFVVSFAIVLILHAMPFPWMAKKVNLLIASYIFYAAWNPPFVILLWLSTVVDWFAARGLARADQDWKRRLDADLRRCQPWDSWLLQVRPLPRRKLRPRGSIGWVEIQPSAIQYQEIREDSKGILCLGA
jgi:hypothetical protein